MESKELNRIFENGRQFWKKVWGTSLLSQVVFISSTKPISSSISLKLQFFFSQYCLPVSGLEVL